MKTFAVLLWGLATAGGVTYWAQNRPAPVVAYPVAAAAPVVVPVPEPVAVESIPIPHAAKPRTAEAFGLLQPGATRTLFVTPPAPHAPYAVTMFLQPVAPDARPHPPGVPMPVLTPMWAGVNPITAPNSQFRVVYAYQTAISYDHYRVFFATWPGSFGDNGGCMLRVISQVPFLADQVVGYPSVPGTPGWSFRMTD